MSQRDIIREGIEKTICSHCDDINDWEVDQTPQEAQEYCRKKAICAYCTDLSDGLLKYEDKLGVVIKVKELPELLLEMDGSRIRVVITDCPIKWQPKRKVSYVAVEPLIKENG